MDVAVAVNIVEAMEMVVSTTAMGHMLLLMLLLLVVVVSILMTPAIAQVIRQQAQGQLVESTTARQRLQARGDERERRRVWRVLCM